VVAPHVHDPHVRVVCDVADGGVRLEGRVLGRRVAEVEAVGLRGVEDVMDGGEERGPGLLFARVVLAGCRCAAALAPDEDGRALLALADHAAGGADLAEPGPAHVAPAPRQGGGEQEHGVVPAVAAAGGAVDGPAELSGLPRFLPGGGAGFQRLDEAVGERAGVLLDSWVHGSSRRVVRERAERSSGRAWSWRTWSGAVPDGLLSSQRGYPRVRGQGGCLRSSDVDDGSGSHCRDGRSARVRGLLTLPCVRRSGASR